MKPFALLSSLIFFTNSFAQQRDTAFIKREVSASPYPFYHAVFIDSSDTYRKELTDFNFTHSDSASYLEQLTDLRPLHNFKPLFKNKFPKKWIALYKFKENFYLYSPSDFGYHYRFEITDSTTIEFGMEGPAPSRLNKILFLSPSHIVINRANYWKGQQVDINLVDITRGIAVFSFAPSKFNNKKYQLLMVDASKAYLYPTIVNYCPTDKQSEFEFDKIDFASLMK